MLGILSDNLGGPHWLSAALIVGGGRRCPGEVCSERRSRGPLLLRLCWTPGWRAGGSETIFLFLSMSQTEPLSR